MKKRPRKGPHFHPHPAVLWLGPWQGQCISPAAHEGQVGAISHAKRTGHKQRRTQGAGEVHPGDNVSKVTFAFIKNLNSAPRVPREHTVSSGETTTRQKVKTRICMQPNARAARELLTPNHRGVLPWDSQGDSSVHTLEEELGRMTGERKRS